eukprot:Hpha_TRINITY_DN13261_c0_g1::TRINITY_DN13261_c0_g1_i1::g.154974::m.154974
MDKRKQVFFDSVLPEDSSNGRAAVMLCLECGHRQAWALLAACTRCSARLRWESLDEGAEEGQGPWMPAEGVKNCPQCEVEFDPPGILARIRGSKKDHCRQCGGVFCTECCPPHRMIVEGYGDALQAACGECYGRYLGEATRIELLMDRKQQAHCAALTCLRRLLPTTHVAPRDSSYPLSVHLLPATPTGELTEFTESELREPRSVVKLLRRRAGYAEEDHWWEEESTGGPEVVILHSGQPGTSVAAGLLKVVLEESLRGMISIRVSGKATVCPYCSAVREREGGECGMLICLLCGSSPPLEKGGWLSTGLVWGPPPPEYFVVEVDAGRDMPRATAGQRAPPSAEELDYVVRKLRKTAERRPPMLVPSAREVHEPFGESVARSTETLRQCTSCGHRQKAGWLRISCEKCGAGCWKSLEVPATQKTEHVWKPHEGINCCEGCGEGFVGVLTTGKHHCRECGGVFCGKCCPEQRMVVEGYGKELQRGCDACYTLYLANAVNVEVNVRVGRPSTDESVALLTARLLSFRHPSFNTRVAVREDPAAAAPSLTLLPMRPDGERTTYTAAEVDEMLGEVEQRLRLQGSVCSSWDFMGDDVSMGYANTEDPRNGGAFKRMPAAQQPFVVLNDIAEGREFQGYGEIALNEGLRESVFLAMHKEDRQEEIMILFDRHRIEESLRGQELRADGKVWGQLYKDVERMDLVVEGRRVRDIGDATRTLLNLVKRVIPRAQTLVRIEPSMGDDYILVANLLQRCLEHEFEGNVGVFTAESDPVRCPTCGHVQVLYTNEWGAEGTSGGLLPRCKACGVVNSEIGQTSMLPAWLSGRPPSWEVATDHFRVRVGSGPTPSLVAAKEPPCTEQRLGQIFNTIERAHFRAAEARAAEGGGGEPDPELPKELQGEPERVRKAATTLALFCQQGAAALGFDIASRQFSQQAYDVHCKQAPGKLSVRVSLVDKDTDILVRMSKRVSLVRVADMLEDRPDFGEAMSELEIRVLSGQPATVRVQGLPPPAESEN